MYSYPDLNTFCEMAADEGKVVIVAALDGDFQRKPFGSVCDLVALSESVTKLSAVCNFCCGDAAFTKRIGSETAIQVIGGSEKYIPVCRACYHSEQTLAPTPEPSITEQLEKIDLDIPSTPSTPKGKSEATRPAAPQECSAAPSPGGSPVGTQEVTA